MANRTSSVERDSDDDEGALFIKDGAPVKFCFHHSVTQGRRHITRDVERHGGQIVRDERHANVLLVDEQLDLAFIRRRYYSSTERYRLTIYVEPRGFVQTCIRAGTYRHVGPLKQGMPGRAPAPAPGAKRVRVEFTEDDREQLAQYLATRFPTRDGRMGNSAYKDLVRLGQTNDETWVWARRHTFHSWREHYKMNPDMMDARIARYLEELKDVGHHFGHDPRRHNHRHVAREEEEEEGEEEEEEDQDQEGRARAREKARRKDHERREGVRRGRVRQERERERERERRAAGAEARMAREHVARRERDRDELAEEEEEGEEEIQFVRHVKRETRHVRDAKQAKRARLSETPSEDDATDAQTGGSPRDKESEDQLPDIEGSDLFGDRMYGDEARFEFHDDDAIVFPIPSPPRTSPGLEQDGAPLSTQATLVASPFGAGNGAWSPVEHRRTVPPTPQPTMERVAVSGARVEVASPSVGRRSGNVVVEVPVRRPRAVVRARSVDVEPAPALDFRGEQREEEGDGMEQELELELDKGKGKARTTEEVLEPIEEDELVGELEEEDQLVGATSGLSAETPEERDVEGLLEVRSEEDGDGENEGVRDQEDHDHDVVEDAVGDRDQDRENEGVHDQDDNDTVADDEDGYMLPGLPSIQEVTMRNESQPIDSDDAETHGMLVRGIAGELVDGDVGDTGQGSAERGETEQEQERNEVPDDGEDDKDEDRAKRTTRGSLRAVRATVEPRTTRSKSATQTQTQVPTQTGPTSPRRTRSKSRVHSTVLPSRVAKVRVEEDVYVPPAGTRASRAVRGKGK